MAALRMPVNILKRCKFKLSTPCTNPTSSIWNYVVPNPESQISHLKAVRKYKCLNILSIFYPQLPEGARKLPYSLGIITSIYVL